MDTFFLLDDILRPPLFFVLKMKYTGHRVIYYSMAFPLFTNFVPKYMCVVCPMGQYCQTPSLVFRLGVDFVLSLSQQQQQQEQEEEPLTKIYQKG